MTSFLPRSLWWFVVTLVTALLLRSPIPGFWLLFLGAPFWPILTVNFGFIALGIEAVTRKTHIIWLIAPLTWFLGYGYVAWESHKAVGVLEDQVRAFNSEKRVSFDPTKQSLVVDPSLDIDNDVVRNLLERYDLPILYHARRGKGSQRFYNAVRISHTESCGPEDMCFYNMRDEAPTSQIVISASYEKKHVGYLEYTATTIKLSDATGNIDLLSDSATPYRWLPFPVTGCGLNSGNPSWDCFTDFLKDSPVWVTARPVDIAAHALGLKPIAPLTAAEVQQRADQQIKASFAAFSEFLTDSSKPIAAVDLKSLTGHPERYDTKAPEMVTALGKVLAEPQPRLEVAAGLGELLAALPDAKFNQVLSQLLNTYATAPEIGPNVIWDRMAFRLGSIGELALPVLERLAFDHKEPLSRAIYALCRVGAAAARDGEKIAEHLQNNRRSDSDHRAAFKTLLRLGRSDMLNKESDNQSAVFSSDYDLWRRTITPDSSSEVCTEHR